MKIAIVDYYSSDIQELKKDIMDAVNRLEKRDDVEFVILGSEKKTRPIIIGEIKKYNPDYLITVDLSGFELETLTDGVAYNLLDCKQFHWVNEIKEGYDKYIKKVLSISMFFAAANKIITNTLVELNENVQCQNDMETFELGGADLNRKELLEFFFKKY